MGFGAFGKIPSAGDFVRSDLAQAFVAPWDRWLQKEVDAARRSLGERWQDCYFRAPIWRFSLAPGVVGPSAMLGVLMPSVDRVGRQFPLTVAAPVDVPHVALHLSAPALFDALEDAALAMLDDLPLAALTERLATLRLPEPGRIVPVGRQVLLLDAAEDAAPALAALCLGRLPSLWSARLDGAARLMRPALLPENEGFAALYDLEAPFWRATA